MGGDHAYFGAFYKLHGIITYRLSPYELRPLYGCFPHNIGKWIRRIKEEFLYVVPPFFVSYVAYDQLEKRHAQLRRKNPADYENEDEENQEKTEEKQEQTEEQK